MGSLRPHRWLLPLLHMLLLQIQHMEVQGVDPLAHKLRRLNEQFQQFQALTQARLDMLALIQNRNSSGMLESRVQALNDHYHHISHDLEHLKQSTTQEIDSLRDWSKKLEKKNKRMESRLAFMERKLRDNCRHIQNERSDFGQDFSNLTLELQNQEERLAVLQIQRDELVVGLKGLQESLQKQELRVIQLEGQLSKDLRWNGKGNNGGRWKEGDVLNSEVTAQGYYEPHRRIHIDRGRRPEGMLDAYAQPRSESTTFSMTDHTTTPQNRAKQPKPSKTQKPRPQPEAHLQRPVQHTDPQLHSSRHDLIQPPHLQHPQAQIQLPAQRRPYPVRQEQLLSNTFGPNQPHGQQHRKTYLRNSYHSAWSQVRPQSSPNRDTRRKNPPSNHRSPGQDEEQEEDSDRKEGPSVIHDFLQLPLRHKIPQHPVAKKDATICNVDSMLFFPSASEENYVTFSLSLPDLPELSMCLWLRVETPHVGTVLSYATVDNDNQFVLYGRNSSAPASSSPFSYYPSSSSKSSPSLDFVIGDPAYRHLPVSSLMDTNWHHLCILWSSIQARFWQYIDRRLVSSGSDFRKGWEIPGGGSVVLGQEQDVVGGGFDSAEGFAGQMAGFRMWNRVLSLSEVEGVAEGKGVPRGVVLSMEDIHQVRGEVQQVSCECLEHCV